MSHDTLLHRIVRPVVVPLAATPVTPNQLTTLRLLTGLGAGAFLAMGQGWRAGGAALFLVSLLLDRADGELARISGRITKGGYRYDLICDCVATVATFLGLGFGLRDRLGYWALALGGIAGLSTVGLFYQINVSKVAAARGVALGGRVLVDPDDAMAALPFLLWLGLAAPTLVVAGVLTPLVMVALLLRSRRSPQSRTKVAAS